jgi:hypothetical protein
VHRLVQCRIHVLLTSYADDDAQACIRCRFASVEGLTSVWHVHVSLQLLLDVHHDLSRSHRCSGRACRRRDAWQILLHRLDLRFDAALQRFTLSLRLDFRLRGTQVHLSDKAGRQQMRRQGGMEAQQSFRRGTVG